LDKIFKFETKKEQVYYYAPPINERIDLIFKYHIEHNSCGRDSLMILLKGQKIHWRGMRTDIQFVLDHCLQCNSKKARAKKVHIPDKIIIADDANDLFEIDISYMGEDELTKDILLLQGCNHFTKKLYSAPGKNKTAQFVLENLEKWYRISKFKRLYCDLGTEFNNNTIHTFCNENSIQYVDTLPFNAKSKGLIEVKNGQVKKALEREMNVRQTKSWVALLPMVVEQLNNTPCSTTKTVPNEAHLILNEKINQTDFKNQADFIKAIANKAMLVNKIYENTKKTGELKQKSKSKGKKTIEIKVGDTVFISPPPPYRSKEDFAFCKLGTVTAQHRNQSWFKVKLGHAGGWLKSHSIGLEINVLAKDLLPYTRRINWVIKSQAYSLNQFENNKNLKPEDFTSWNSSDEYPPDPTPEDLKRLQKDSMIPDTTISTNVINSTNTIDVDAEDILSVIEDDLSIKLPTQIKNFFKTMVKKYGIPWKDNSCALDAFLHALFAAIYKFGKWEIQTNAKFLNACIKIIQVMFKSILSDSDSYQALIDLKKKLYDDFSKEFYKQYVGISHWVNKLDSDLFDIEYSLTFTCSKCLKAVVNNNKKNSIDLVDDSTISDDTLKTELKNYIFVCKTCDTSTRNANGVEAAIEITKAPTILIVLTSGMNITAPTNIQFNGSKYQKVSEIYDNQSNHFVTNMIFDENIFGCDSMHGHSDFNPKKPPFKSQYPKDAYNHRNCVFYVQEKNKVKRILSKSGKPQTNKVSNEKTAVKKPKAAQKTKRLFEPTIRARKKIQTESGSNSKEITMSIKLGKGEAKECGGCRFAFELKDVKEFDGQFICNMCLAFAKSLHEKFPKL
jgi:hypothetical protein